MLQGRPKVCKGGKSATMMYAYPFTLPRRAVVITMDVSAANLDLLYTDHWLSNPQNVMLVKLTTPAWDAGALAEHVPAETKDAAVGAWAVADVASFLRQHDLSGPANVLFANGVNGVDFLEMTSRILQDELRLSAFAARKVLRARDGYLHSP